MLPVAIDGGAFDLDPERLEHVSFIRLDVTANDEKAERLLFHTCVAGLRLLEGRDASVESAGRAPVSVFVSHAKADLPKAPDAGADDPVHALMLEMDQGPVEHWYDAKEIPPGGKFPEEIKAGVLDCTVMIAVVTNKWSSREWCRREVLEAKDARRPILVVDHITDEKPRLFPYLGNAPVMRWRDRHSARVAVTFAVREALRYRFNVASLQSFAEANDVIFGTKPELLSVTGLPEGIDRVVYPDPPLGEEELVELRKVRQTLKFHTPLSAVAAFEPPGSFRRIAISLSTAADSLHYGGSAGHLGLVADDLNLFLLLAGFSIAYGGSMFPVGVTDDEANYVQRLFSTARSHSPLCRQLRAGQAFEIIQNYVAWPLHLRYGPPEFAAFGAIADFVPTPRPKLSGIDENVLNVEEDGFFKPESAEQRFAWARGLTTMREAMRDAPDIGARVALGGKLEGYAGRYPGVLEEVLLDIRAGRPVFLLGAFGGAARLAYDALRGENREELSYAWVTGISDAGSPRVPHFERVRELHIAAGLEMKTPEELAEEFASLAKRGLAAVLNNGLDDAENRELAESANPFDMVALVLTGLRRLADRG